MPNTFLTQYRNSLKNAYAEEAIDLALYRPLAFIFVKITEPLPLTPNFVSLLAMIAGIAAGVVFAQGGAANFVAGGLLFALSNILDCSDGMIARLKKNGTKTGRIVDGLVDYVASGQVYIGFAIGLTAKGDAFHFPGGPWLFMLPIIVSTVLHSITSDKCRNAFLRQQSGAPDAADDERRIFAEELARLRQLSGRLFDKTLVRIYLRYLDIQKGKNAPAAKDRPTRPVSRTSMVLWNLIGPSTHITFVILAALLYNPWVLFVYTVGIANLSMVGLLAAQAMKKSRTA